MNVGAEGEGRRTGGGPRPKKRSLGLLSTGVNDAILEMCVENKGRPLARALTDFVEYTIEALAAGELLVSRVARPTLLATEETTPPVCLGMYFVVGCGRENREAATCTTNSKIALVCPLRQPPVWFSGLLCLLWLDEAPCVRLNQVRVSRHCRCVAIMMYIRDRILCGGAALGTAISGQHHSSAGADSHRSGEAVPDAMDCGDARGYAARERCISVGFALLLLRFRVAET